MTTQEVRPPGTLGGDGSHARFSSRETDQRPYRDDLYQNQAQGGTETLANALGWLSLGLGIAGVAAPREVARCIGLSDDERTRELLRMIGIREIISGVGILSQPRPGGWLWSRVAGDLMDLALLGNALQRPDARQERVAATTAVVAGITALDLMASQKVAQEKSGWQGIGEDGSTRVRTVTIYRPIEEVYSYWRKLENLPLFMRRLKSVRELDERRSRWAAEGPAGMTVEWEAEIVEDRKNELIAWRSVEGSQVHHCGEVTFRQPPHRQGTEVRVQMEFCPPGGILGELAAKLFGKDPGQQIKDDLRAFKQVLETGELLESDGTVNSWPMIPQRPAQPPTEEDLAAAA